MKATSVVGIGSLCLALLALCSSAQAVELSDNGVGQVVILPVFAATEQLTTLVTVSSTQRLQSKALRVRLLDRDGSTLRSINVYLGPFDTWTAALVRQDDDVMLQSSDASCAFEANAAGDVVPLASSSELLAAHGSIEVFEMGDVGTVELSEAIRSQQCGMLLARWNGGEWSADSEAGLYPSYGEVRANVSLINVQKGTLYAVAGTALSSFSDIVQHTNPADSLPHLGSGHDAGTDGGSTTARVCGSSGCRTATFANPIDAVSAVLMANDLHADYVVQESLGASSEFLVHYPTRHHYPEGAYLSTASIALGLANRDGSPLGRDTCIDSGSTNPPSDFCGEIARIGFNHSRSVEVISINRSNEHLGQVVSSAILGMPHRVEVPPAGFVVAPAGVARVGLDSFMRFYLGSQNNGLRFNGRPAIGVMFTEVVNANLHSVDGVQQRANYGAAAAATRLAPYSN